MKFRKLNLAAFRAFDQLELEFEDDLTVIAGVNGVGKTSILEAIATILSRALPECTVSTSRARSFDDDDVSLGHKALEVSGIFAVGDYPCHGIVQRTKGVSKPDQSFLLLEKLYSSSNAGEVDTANLESRIVLRQLRTRNNQPVGIFFSPARRLPGKPQRLHTPDMGDKTKAFAGALDNARSVELREFMEWFNVFQDSANWFDHPALMKNTAANKRVLDGLRSAVQSFLPGISNPKVVYDPKPRFLVNKNGASLQISQLSDGERGLLAMIFDITRRLTLANPETLHAMADGKGIILIDEIELHLHPEWQRKALELLRSIFHGCQFIVTTHSPQVLGEVDARCVRYLFRDDDGRVRRYTPERALGLDTNRILEEIMGTRSRNERTQSFLHDLFRAIDREQFGKAEDLMETVSTLLGEFDPELVRARLLMGFLREDNEEHHEES